MYMVMELQSQDSRLVRSDSKALTPDITPSHSPSLVAAVAIFLSPFAELLRPGQERGWEISVSKNSRAVGRIREDSFTLPFPLSTCPTGVMDVPPQGSLPPMPFPLSLKWHTILPYQAPQGKKSPFQTLLSA